MNRAEILNCIEVERTRQIDLPGSEMDVRNTPNEWAAIVAHYVTAEVRRGGLEPSRDAFETGLIKAAAVILAALENCDSMQELEYFRAHSRDQNSFAEALQKLEEHRDRT